MVKKMKTYEVKVHENGDIYWYLNGKHHREDGPAIEFANGDKYWCMNGKNHREDGPAIEFANGDKFWFLNGKRHREDGPAVEYVNGDNYWLLNGVEYTEAEFNAKMNTVKELSVADIEKLLGCKVKIVK